MNERISRLRLISYPVEVGRQKWERHPNTEDYQIALRLAFAKWGLPQRIQVDHGSVFYDSHHASPFPSRLHLWLLALGVDLEFGRLGRPQDQGMTERSHQLWGKQVLEGQSFDDWQDLYLRLQARGQVLNQLFPSASLEEQAPLVAYPQAKHSGRFYQVTQEAKLLNLAPLWDYLAQGRWYRYVGASGPFSLGGKFTTSTQLGRDGKSKSVRMPRHIPFRPLLMMAICSKSFALIISVHHG